MSRIPKAMWWNLYVMSKVYSKSAYKEPDLLTWVFAQKKNMHIL